MVEKRITGSSLYKITDQVIGINLPYILPLMGEIDRVMMYSTPTHTHAQCL